LILTVGRSDWWIKTELQNRFRLDFRFGFGILRLDDGMPDFWIGEEKWGYRLGPSICLLTNGFEHHKCYGKYTQKVYGITVS